jgi:hypothetical protein
MDFDSDKYYLGNICKHNHNWDDTRLSLRLIRNDVCLECLRVSQKKYRQKNIEKSSKYLKQYRIDKKEILKKKQHEFYLNNKDNILKKCKQYRDSLGDKHKKKNIEYNKKYLTPDIIKIRNNKAKLKYPKKRTGMLKYAKKRTEKLCEAYVKHRIEKTYLISKKDITPQMIELKRELMQFNRLTKELENVINRR